MKIVPCEKNLYLVLEKVEEKRVGNVLLPDMHSEQCRIATIMDIGDDVPSGLFKVGERVLIHFFAGTVIHIVESLVLDDTHRIVNYQEVLAKIE